MRLSHIALIALFLLGLPALAQESPKAVVESFYKDYKASTDRPAEDQGGDSAGWISWLMKKQTAHVEPELRDYLLKLEASDISERGPLNADPFSNGYWAVASYTVKEPTMKDGLAYVPVAMYVGRGKGPEVVRVRLVLRDSGNGWKIANAVYPAIEGQPAWNLLDELKKLLG